MYKIGDRVRRVKGTGYGNMKIGDIGTIIDFENSNKHGLVLSEFDGVGHSGDNFELVESYTDRNLAETFTAALDGIFKIPADTLKQKTSALDIQISGSHYNKMVIQPVEFITKNNIGYIEGNVIKYICRYADKNGKEDLEKVKHYVDLLIEAKYP